MLNIIQLIKIIIALPQTSVLEKSNDHFLKFTADFSTLAKTGDHLLLIIL